MLNTPFVPSGHFPRRARMRANYNSTAFAAGRRKNILSYITELYSSPVYGRGAPCR